MDTVFSKHWYEVQDEINKAKDELRLAIAKDPQDADEVTHLKRKVNRLVSEQEGCIPAPREFDSLDVVESVEMEVRRYVDVTVSTDGHKFWCKVITNDGWEEEEVYPTPFDSAEEALDFARTELDADD